jgi:hypothetical protein
MLRDQPPEDLMSVSTAIALVLGHGHLRGCQIFGVFLRLDPAPQCFVHDVLDRAVTASGLYPDGAVQVCVKVERSLHPYRIPAYQHPGQAPTSHHRVAGVID